MRPSVFLFFVCAAVLPAQDADPGRLTFEGRCARCHGADGNGGELGPAIRNRLAARNDQQLAALIRTGLPAQGMPPSDVNPAEMEPLTRFLRTLQPRTFRRQLETIAATLTSGDKLEGEILNQGFEDLQLRTADQHVHLLRRVGDKFREVTSGVDWPGYNGDPGGNRYTTLSQITRANVSRLAPKWIFTVPNAGRMQVTPVVVGGIMYVSKANECYALDAGTGRQVWRRRMLRLRRCPRIRRRRRADPRRPLRQRCRSADHPTSVCRVRRWSLASRDCAATEQRAYPRAARANLGTVDDPRQLAARHRHPQQRTLHRQARLEPADLYQGPHYGQTPSPSEPARGLGRPGGSGTADHR